MKRIVFLFVCSCLLWSCSEDEVTTTPSITFVSIEPTTIVSAQEKVTIRISYFDGDGDLGENDADIKNLFVTDSRNNVRFSFRIPALAPSGEAISIQGQLPIELNNVALMDGTASQETVQYTIHVVDRAGNESNSVETSMLTITAQ